MDIVSNFKLWLQNKKFSSSTTRNYLADVNKYLNWMVSQDIKASEDEIFSRETLGAYVSSISTDKNYDRYLSSLSKFCHFAIDQAVIKSNPLKNIKNTLSREKPLDLENILKQYQEFMAAHRKTPATIKNYLNDIRQFISWAQTNPDET